MNTLEVKLNPNWVTGFIDGEGCFFVGVYKRKDYVNLSIRSDFMVKLHIRDLDILKQIQYFFNNVGNIHVYKTFAVYRVQNKKDLLNEVIPHFDNYPLITEKQNDFKIFKNILNILEKTCSASRKIDLIEIIRWKASLNKGLSKDLKTTYPYVIPIERPANLPVVKIDPIWFAGFFSGEGSFYVTITKKLSYKLGYAPRIGINVGQHSRDKVLIHQFINLFGCGQVREYKNKNYVEFYVTNFHDITSKVIPFFKTYPIIGIKSLDFTDFCYIQGLIKDKAHLTKEGLLDITIIMSKMNKGRY